jgi:hypothetical protein
MPIEELGQIGSAFGARGLKMQQAQQQQQFKNKSYIGEQALKMIDERAAAGDVQFLNDPDLQKHLKPFIGPQTMEALLPFKQKEAEMNANRNQMKANIAKFSAFLGQQQQQGKPLAPNAIPSLVGAGESVGMKPNELESAGLRVKPEKVTEPAELNARAQAAGYNSFKEAPVKVKQQILSAQDANKRESPGEKAAGAAASEKAKIDVQRAEGIIPPKADPNAAAGKAEVPPEPGKLPAMLDFNQFQVAHPEYGGKQAQSLFAQQQRSYKTQQTAVLGIERAKNQAAKIADDITKYMDDQGMNTPDSFLGRLTSTATTKAAAAAPNLSPPQYQKLYTKISQLRAAALPSYLVKGSPRSQHYLEGITKHLPNPGDNPGFIREQISGLKPFIEQIQEENRQAIANDFAIPYVPKPPAPTPGDELEKYKVP